MLFYLSTNIGENISQSQSIHKLRATCNRDTCTSLEAICLKNEKKYFFFLFLYLYFLYFRSLVLIPSKNLWPLNVGV